jgi:hypothetical protein
MPEPLSAIFLNARVMSEWSDNIAKYGTEKSTPSDYDDSVGSKKPDNLSLVVAKGM